MDEAGDLTLFNKRGKLLLGREGVSSMFMVGVATLPDPSEAHRQLEALRAALIEDPYFKGVPSMQPAARKTAICFHAKDDLPEIRREVFRLLPALHPKVLIAIRRKRALAEEAERRYRRSGRKLRADAIYDDLVKRLFRDLLHKAQSNRITIARRGKSDRQEALQAAIRKARRNFEKKYGIRSDRPTQIIPAYPDQSAGLQVVDYHLWAVQRLFERREPRFFASVSDQVRLIMDLDDRRNNPYGEWYCDTNPLTLDKIKPAAG